MLTTRLFQIVCVCVLLPQSPLADELRNRELELAIRAYDDRKFFTAERLFTPLAEAGHAEAQFYIGRAIANIRRDDRHKEAARWYRKAAERGFAEAQVYLAGLYFVGNGVPKDEVEAIRWYRLAAEQDHVFAQYQLGRIYFGHGYDVPDPPEGRRWLELAGQNGHLKAQLLLAVGWSAGYFGEKGQLEQASKWFLAAAKSGNASAQFEISWRYQFGDGIEQNLARSIYWLRKAALQNHPVAQGLLAGQYRRGHGLRKDLAKAYKWAIVSLAEFMLLEEFDGVKTAYEELEEIRKEISIAELKEGQRLVEVWNERIVEASID